MSGEPGYLRWTPAEWLKVAAHAIPHLDKGLPPNKALMKAQRTALSKPRHRDEGAIRQLVGSDATKKYLEQARALPPERRAEIAPPPPPRKMPPPREKLDKGRDYSRPGGEKIKWTTLEKARVARQVDDWIAAGDTRVLARLIIEAQEAVIEPDRRRPVRSIGQGAVGGANSLNAKMMAEGRINRWLLQDEEQTPPAPVTDAAAAGPSSVEADATTPQPLPQPLPQQVTQALHGAAADEPATTPLDHKPRALSEAARAFGDTVMGALDKLLAVHTETLLTAVYAKLSAAAADTSAQIATQIAAHIERGMRETVHKIVEAELGGPVSPPTAGDAPAPEPTVQAQQLQQPEPEPERVRPIKVDVVGLNNGSMEQEVRKALNGHADLRFFEPDVGNGYAPHRGRHCIMVTQRVPHSLKHKIKAAGVEPIYVKSTSGHVIHAIEELHRSQSVGL